MAEFKFFLLSNLYQVFLPKLIVMWFFRNLGDLKAKSFCRNCNHKWTKNYLVKSTMDFNKHAHTHLWGLMMPLTFWRIVKDAFLLEKMWRQCTIPYPKWEFEEISEYQSYSRSYIFLIRKRFTWISKKKKKKDLPVTYWWQSWVM